MTRFAFLDTNGPIAFAHRGAAMGCAENTHEAVETAVSMGYRYVETDIQASRDGVPVLWHDETTDRLLGPPGRIADYEWSDLAARRCTGGGRPTRLDQILSDFPDLRLNLDPKTDDAVKPMVRAIKMANAVERVCVGSFKPARISALRDALGPDLCWSPGHAEVARHWLRGWGVPVPSGNAPVLQVPLHWNAVPVVTRRMLNAVHVRGVHVHVWTIDDPQQMERLLDLGVDGLMTDRPKVLKSVFQIRGLWPQSP